MIVNVRRAKPDTAAFRPWLSRLGAVVDRAPQKGHDARAKATALMPNSCLITVDTPNAHVLMSDYGAAFGLYGYVHSTSMRLTSITLELKQKRRCSSAQNIIVQTGMIDPNRAETLEPGFVLGLDAGFYVSATFPNNINIVPGLAYVDASIRWNNNTETTLRLCSAQVERVEREKEISFRPEEKNLVGIAMATYNPDPILFKEQIESIKAQSHSNWICLISDDGSDVSHFNYILQTVSGDRRFVIRKNLSKVGFYRNFERALAGLPSQCSYVAFSDQDDIWKPNKLSQQIIKLSSTNAECVYSDMEIALYDGTILSRSFWVNRRQPYGSLAGLLLANVATGTSMLLKQPLAELALPFPSTPNLTYHDHWIALLAESRASLKYISDPLVQYIQHGENHTGALTPPERARDAFRRGLKRITEIVFMPFKKINPPENRAKLSAAAFWTDFEPCRLRILILNILYRQRAENVRRASRQMVRMGKNFGIVEMLTANVDWHDRYRRAYAVELALGGVLKMLIALYVNFRKARQK
jgi:glycosyltransferase involved in cell wall biosynthesis